MNNIFLGMPPANVQQWIRDHHGPVVKETTVVKYTAASGLPDWEGNIVGELANNSIPNMSNAEVVEIGSHVTSIATLVFAECTSLTSVTIPGSVTSIGNTVFGGCSNLTSVTIGDGVISIGSQAFGSCYKLTSLTIPNSVTSIGGAAFEYCGKLKSVTFSGKDKATVQDMSNYFWNLGGGCIVHCIDGDIDIPY